MSMNSVIIALGSLAIALTASAKCYAQQTQEHTTNSGQAGHDYIINNYWKGDDLPTIPDADSGWVDGGSNPHKFCDPHLKAIEAKYPNFKITMTVLPEQHRSEYNPFKHDVYRYLCSFTASKK
jgi:hypothetical protein